VNPFVLPLLLVVAFSAPMARGDGVEVDRSCAEAVARKVQRHYEAVTDLRARFSQTRQGPGAAGLATREGTVVAAKPGRMRWSYETPEPSLLVTDGQVLWMYDPLLEEAQRLPNAGGVLSSAAVQFLMGEGDLLAAFRVEAVDCDASPVRLELLPRTDVGYERLSLEVDAESGGVLASTVTDLFGNRTRVAFQDVRVNTAPEAALFTFEPPEGVEVFDLLTPSVPGGSGR